MFSGIFKTIEKYPQLRVESVSIPQYPVAPFRGQTHFNGYIQIDFKSIETPYLNTLLCSNAQYAMSSIDTTGFEQATTL